MEDIKEIDYRDTDSMVEFYAMTLFAQYKSAVDVITESKSKPVRLDVQNKLLGNIATFTSRLQKYERGLEDAKNK